MLQRKLQQVANDKDKKRVITSVLRSVAQSTVKAARANAPVSRRPHVVSGRRTKQVIQPGSLKKSIGVIVGKKGTAKQNAVVYAGPRAKGKNTGWYGHLVELGHNIYRSGFKRTRSATAKARAHNASGTRSKTKGFFYMKKAYESTKGGVTADAEKRVAKVIQRQIDKLSN